MTVLRRTLEKAPLTVEVVEDDMSEWRLRGRGGGAAGTGKGRGRGGGRKTGAGREVLNEVAVDEDGYAEGASVPLSEAEQATICKKQADGMILEMTVLVLHQIFTQLPLLIHLCQTNFNHNLMFETVLHH